MIQPPTRFQGSEQMQMERFLNPAGGAGDEATEHSRVLQTGGQRRNGARLQ